LQTRLLTRNINVQGNTIVKPLNEVDCIDNRDSIAKALYDGLFLWVVNRINQQSVGKSAHDITVCIYNN
jgi:myosin heavy subunit